MARAGEVRTRPIITHEVQQAKERVACFLHFQFANSDNENYTLDILKRAIRKHKGRIIDLAMHELFEQGLVTLGPNFYGLSGYQITDSGIRLVDDWSDEHYQEVAADVDFDFVDETDGTGEPFDDPEWSPLPLEREGEAFQDALDKTELALKEISSNNGYAVSDPEEREHIVWSISEGLRQLRDGIPTKEQVQVFLVKPLKYVANKFASASLGEVAKSAVKALLSWLL